MKVDRNYRTDPVRKCALLVAFQPRSKYGYIRFEFQGVLLIRQLPQDTGKEPDYSGSPKVGWRLICSYMSHQNFKTHSTFTAISLPCF